MTALYDAALEPAGINVAQWGLLRRLDTAQPDPVSIQALAERAELERSTVARNVRVLEKLGLLRMGESRQDRRFATIALTAAGRATLDHGAPLWEAAQSQVEKMLGDSVAQELRSVLLSL